MKKGLELRCVDLTQEAIARYIQRDAEFVLSLCAEDVLFVAPEKGRYMHGVDAMRQDFQRNRDVLVPSHMSQTEFEVVQNSGDACSVVGHYLVTTDDDVDTFLQVAQRCQFTWERRSGELRLVSVLVCNASGELIAPDGKTMAESLGKIAHRYIQARIAAQEDKRRVVLPQVGGSVRFVSLDEVVWIGARRKHTAVHTVSGDFEAGIGLSEVAQLLGPEFVAVHRSYVVNPGYVASVGRREVRMTDGTTVPVPEKRHAQVLRDLSSATR